VCADRDRCHQAGIPDDTEFATKPELGRRMLERAPGRRVPFSWLAADEVYGQNPGLRSWLEGEDISYVMAVPCSETFRDRVGQDARRCAGGSGARRRVAHDELRRRLESPGSTTGR